MELSLHFCLMPSRALPHMTPDRRSLTAYVGLSKALLNGTLSGKPALRSSTRRDLQVISFVAKKDAVILGAKTDDRRFDALWLFGIADPAAGITSESFENPHGSLLVDTAQVRTSLAPSGDSLSHCGAAWAPARRPSFPNRPLSNQNPRGFPRAGLACYASTTRRPSAIALVCFA